MIANEPAATDDAKKPPKNCSKPRRSRRATHSSPQTSYRMYAAREFDPNTRSIFTHHHAPTPRVFVRMHTQVSSRKHRPLLSRINEGDQIGLMSGICSDATSPQTTRDTPIMARRHTICKPGRVSGFDAGSEEDFFFFFWSLLLRRCWRHLFQVLLFQ